MCEKKTCRNAEEVRLRFMETGETFVGYFLKHVDDEHPGDQINYTYYAGNLNPNLNYRVSAEKEFVLDLAPEKVMSANEYAANIDPYYQGVIEAYAVYSSPKTQ